MKTIEQWLDYLSSKKGKITAVDIEQIQHEAIEQHKSQYHNPGNIARAERINKALRSNVRII